MPPEVKKSQPVRLRSLALDEKWLQDRIEEDPSLLRLGDLQMVRREKAQPTGGRIDFVLYDPDEEIRYEVEVMLGALDESHIIRTIEYWDLERQRYPSFDHRAVIVAEEITARFFNVIRLLNRAVPLIALQLEALSVGSDVVLHVTKVLDIYEEVEPEDDQSGPEVGRKVWEKRASSSSLQVFDKLVALVQAQVGSVRVTYNRNHIALGTSGPNFCWSHPPREAAHLHLRVRCWGDTREPLLRQLKDTPLYARAFRRDLITLKLSMSELDAHLPLITEAFRQCELGSRGDTD